ncbi:serine/threonine protein kinase [Streptomyces sp. LRE541]|uniref:serine/threonine-protein kinase n=1 Tax=Streptomyces sp. LRE541 TaxID=2931983 RepID=UPI00200FC45D|nr:serine/threonine-protein kinase [Streptomyces sp. LRE541]UPZ26396.1 serine/threonine protein kinase [Streptomyces sp. LRE541]
MPDTHVRELGPEDPDTVGGYRLAGVLGAGGMGKVYLAHTPGGRPVAVKVIRPEFGEDAEFRSRFEREVRSAQRVDGLCTTPVIDFDIRSAQPWLATAYVPGPSLGQVVAEHGALPLRSVLLLTVGIAEALTVIHAAGIVHRDLKPANVLLAADGPRVIDFGIAHAADASALTRTGVSVGTPAFMAPEQASGRPVTAATDVFALGQVAAYASTGSPAYGEGATHAILYRIVHEDPDLDAVPDALRPLLTACLARDPAARPAPAAVMALCHALAAEPLRQTEDWLPRPVTRVIAARRHAHGPAALADGDPPAYSPTHVSPPSLPRPGTVASQGRSGTGLEDAETRSAPPQTGAASAPGHHPPPAPGPTPHLAPPHHSRQPMPPVPAMPAAAPGGRRTGAVVALAVAAVLAVGVGYALLPDGSSGDHRSGSPGSPTSGAASGGEPRSDPEPSAYRAVSIPANHYVMLADDPPRPLDAESGEADLAFEPRTLNVTERDQIRTRNGQLVLLAGAQKGSLGVCRAQTRYTREIDLDQVTEGAQICVLSDAGHIAVATYRGRSAPSEPSAYIDFDLTVWRNAEEPREGR